MESQAPEAAGGAAERPGQGAREFERARRFERALIRVRWFGVLLGVYLVSQTNIGVPPRASDTVLALGFGCIGGLAVGNFFVWLTSRRARTSEQLARVGLGAFALDIAVVLALAWVYSYDPHGFVWVAMYILPLEGALRYQVRGALAVAVLIFLNESGREAYLAYRFPKPGLYGGAVLDRYPFLIANVVFRTGIAAIISVVAGFMARTLAREAQKAEDQAARYAEVARRETLARREIGAFNTAILTGVAAEDLDRSLRLMAEAVGQLLQYETFTIMLREGDELVVKGMYGMPFYDGGVPIGHGVTGTAAQDMSPLRVPDVTEFPTYIMVDPEVKSEMAAPMKIGDELIGVIDVESRTPDAFDDDDLAGLMRLADQIALVAHSNRLLSHQRETMQRLEELDQMKSDFVAITSHELRTPLTAIRGYVRTLIRNRDRIPPEQADNFLTIIDRQSQRLARLVEELLAVSRIEAGTLRLDLRPANLRTFLRQVVEAVGPADGSRVTLDAGVEDVTVMIDPDRVEQVLRNLMENALRFSSPETRVVLGARLDGEFVELTVKDQGRGIAPEVLPHIFERFHQAGPVLTRTVEGAGLGLYITKQLVEAMAGTIDVESEPEHGSTFIVRLPRGAPPEPNGDKSGSEVRLVGKRGASG